MRLILTQPQLKAFDTRHSADAIHAALLPLHGALGDEDIVVLPEHIAFDGDAAGYMSFVSGLAREFGCNIVGGSHHEARGEGRVNTGIAVTPDGATAGRYDKLRPYADERARVRPGVILGEFELAGLRILTLVCADFWFSDLFARATVLPDLVLVPALSVTRKSAPDYSRDLWRHLAVTRAYEFGVYVGISDWGHPSQLPSLFASGVGGFADPTGLDPNTFFTPIGEAPMASFVLDRSALDAFREDRRKRGFFWNVGHPER
ncbi:MAG: carbon-nitrogen hydrolase family protein [Ignavibacteria bacterium]|nr:carbon-nitrogen hydrolase family protein [Ignavibacteria bacterium]